MSLVWDMFFMKKFCKLPSVFVINFNQKLLLAWPSYLDNCMRISITFSQLQKYNSNTKTQK